VGEVVAKKLVLCMLIFCFSSFLKLGCGVILFPAA
jgi:hypothetical protein